MGIKHDNNLKILNEVATEKGLSQEGIALLARIMKVESGGDENARPTIGANGKRRSSAAGLFQITDGTWDGLVSKHPKELTQNGRSDPEQQVTGAIYLTQDNEKSLTKALERKPDSGELYLAHFLGAGSGKGKGAIDVIKEADKNPDTPIKGLLSDRVLEANGYKSEKDKGVRLKTKDGVVLFKDFNVSDLKVWTNRKMEQPDGYEVMTAAARDEYRKKHNTSNSIPDALGDMVNTIVDNVVKIVTTIGKSLKGLLLTDASTDSLAPPQTPSTNTPSKSSPSPAG